MTTSTSLSDGTATVDLRTPGQLLAATPHLLGFHPADSVLVVGHTGEQGRRIGHVLRGDLPPPGDEHALANQLRRPLLADGSVAATIAVVGGRREEQSAGPPHRGLVDAVRGAFTEADLPVTHALWVPRISSGEEWLCYADSTCRGRLPDVDSTVMAAVAAHAGVVTYSSREAMARQLDATDPDALARRAALLDTAIDDLGNADDAGDPEAAAERGLARVRSALKRVERDEHADFSDDEITGLALALGVPAVRDPCLALAVPPGTRRAAVAERLWLALVRAMPAPERAQPACLLAYSAYVRGEGALAGMAIEKALEADPEHVLAGLLIRALEHALPPAVLSRLGESCDDAGLLPPDRPPTPGSARDDPG